MNITFEDLDIDMGDGYFIKSYEVVPEVKAEDSSFTATGLGGCDVIVPRFDPVLGGLDVTSIEWGDDEGNEYHSWNQGEGHGNVPPESYFQACYAHAMEKENEERILDHWICEHA